MSTETTRQGDVARAGGPAALNDDEDKRVQGIKGASDPDPVLGSVRLREGMPPEERRKITAQWLSTWLREGDARMTMN
jgi:hypothetical protein